MFWENVREESLNIMLAELLAESGLKAIGEIVIKVFKKRMPDVLLDINGIRIIIEGKYPGKRESLYKDAYRRIEEGLCDVVLMVEYARVPYPRTFEITQLDIKEALKKAKYNVGFITYIDLIGIEKWGQTENRFINEFYENIGFTDLIAHLMAAYDYIVREPFLDKVIEKLERQIFSFAEKVVSSGVNVDRLKRALELRKGG